MWLEIICGVLVVLILLLSWKIMTMRRAAREIREGMTEKLGTATNTLLTIDSRDRDMCALADALNIQLRRLRAGRQKYEQGNLALQENITNVSHDIRTPLTAICGYLELLEGEDHSAAAQRYLAIIRERTERLKRLTEELLVYAVALPADGMEEIENMTSVSCERRQKKTYKETVLNSVLEESISAYYGALKSREITPQITMPETEVIRRVIPGALSRVFENILGNAVKYSDGDLRIRLRESGEITFANHASALDAVQVGKLFDRFYTVEDAAQSTGLGLAIARLLTEQMGGRITAQYADGIFTVCVRFPEES